MNPYTCQPAITEQERVALILWNLLQAVDELHRICAEMVDHRDARLVAAGERILYASVSFDSPGEMEKLNQKLIES